MKSTALRNQLRDQQLISMRQAALQQENATLRGLNAAMPEVIEKRLIGEVISVEVSTLRQRLLTNRGGNSGVHKAQPVITGDGVIGQVYRTGPFSSEIILITDSEHALPVQVLRSGVRTIALGTGRATALELPYVPQNYDVKVGDVLVTSGLDQVFPFGLPVGRVTRVERDPTQPLAQIFAAPLAKIESDREVLFIWARPDHPASPASTEALTVEAPAQMNLARREPRWAVTFTVLMALILQVLPLPDLARVRAPVVHRRWWSSTGAFSRRTPAAFSRPGSRAWRSTYSRAMCSVRTRSRSRSWRTSP